MAIETDFLELMGDTVTIYSTASVDKYGKRTTSGTGTKYNCRVQAQSETLRDTEGRTIDVVANVYVYGMATVANGDRVLLPDGSTPVVVMVNNNNDQVGNYYTSIKLGR